MAYVRWSRYLLPTWKEEPAEADLPSHRLMLRAGLIRKLAAGIYEFLPLGLRVLRKVEAIVREEMNAAGGIELRMPVLQPEELWRRTGRWEDFGPEMFKLRDRKGQGFALGPTHEEVFTELAAREIRSYRDLPLLLYQIGEKYRDEIRPRYGVMRAREFVMKDAYSFHSSWESLEETYRAMYDAYLRAFVRCGLKIVVVEAPSGLMGGPVSHEFMALAESGEEEVVLCESCGYAANRQVARSRPPAPPPGEEGQLKLIPTPGVRTVEELVSSLGVDPRQVVKTFLYVGRAGPMAVLVRGDQELEEAKLIEATGDSSLRRVDDAEEAESLAGAPFGFLGPIGLSLPIWADEAVRDLPSAVVGANQVDHHYVGAKPDRDFRVDRYLDLHRVACGDSCAGCGAPLSIRRGIEVGQIFQLGVKYSQALGATFLDERGEAHPMIMGCYGIGISRIVAAVVEQHHDEEGIIWPVSVAPFQVVVTVLDPKERQRELGEAIAARLDQAGFEVLLDDRLQNPGEKFHDAKLIGIPLMVVVGPRSLEKGKVELERRADGLRATSPADPEALVGKVKQLLRVEII
ncbi:MAG TPA: proline--tRNA ligase [Candidatus Acetothermia bacterium]|nr:proline--tRNA ligase [Candidatus Acetothermia bacterium]